MNIRCLIGHDYGDTRTSHEREERGDEVVVTAIEYRECSRCGDRRIVSENKEVTSIEVEAEPEDDGSVEDAAADDARVGVPEVPETPEYDDVTAEEDDGVILEDDPETEERARGEWPARPDDEGAEERADAEPREWPDAGGEDEGYAATAADDDPVDDVEFGGGLAPESRTGSSADAEDAGEWVEDPSDAPGGRSPGSDPSPTPQRPSGADTVFVCPDCGYTASPQGSSLRPGDICPECREGYLAERETATGE